GARAAGSREPLPFCPSLSPHRRRPAAPVRGEAPYSTRDWSHENQNAPPGAHRGGSRVSRPATLHPGLSRGDRHDSRRLSPSALELHPIERVSTRASPSRGVSVSAVRPSPRGDEGG